MSDDDRTREPTELRNLFSSFGLEGMSSMTDEQWAEHDAKVAAERERERAERERHIAQHPTPALERLGWASRALKAATAADDTRESIQRLMAVNFEDTNVVVLSGDPGCGKTVAAAYWAQRDKRFGQRVRFVRAATFAASSRYDQETRALWYHAHALVLDDLGAEYLDAKGSFNVDLDELIDTYYAEERPLIITTNLQAAAFKQRYGERVVDRIRECGKWVDISASSMRRRTA